MRGRMRVREAALALVVAGAVAACGIDVPPTAAAPVAPGAAQATTTTVPSCATVDQLVAARLLERALEALAANPACLGGGRRAAIEDQVGRVEGLLAEARTAVAAADPDRARTALLAAAALSADPEIAAMLDAVDAGGATDPFTVARRLHDAGFDDEADAVVVAAVKDGREVPDDAGDLDDRRGVVEWALDNWVRILLALAVATAVVLELLRRTGRRRAHLAFRTSTCADAEPIAVFTRARLREVEADVPSTSLAIASVPPAPVDLPDLGEIDGGLKPAEAAIAWALRRDAVTAAVMVTENEKGAGRLLGVDVYDDRAGRSTTWHVPDLGDRNLELRAAAGYAAGWLTVEVARLRPRRLATADRAAAIGTADGESLGAFLAGVEAFDAGRLDTAAAWFLTAVERDPGHRRARHNLDVVLGSGGVGAAAAAARDLLRLVGPKTLSTTPFERDTVDWYRTSFNAATILTNLAAQLPADPDPAPPDRQEGVLLRAADTLTDVLRATRDERRVGIGPDLRDWLRRVRVPAVVLAVGILDLWRTEPPHGDDAPTVDDDVWVIVERFGAELHAREKDVLLGLLDAAAAAVAREVPRNDLPGALAEIVVAVEQEPVLPARARYNLACFHASAGRWDSAVAHLAVALPADHFLRSWAGRDTTLAPLRAERPADWERVVAGDGAPPVVASPVPDAASPVPEPDVTD